MDPATASYEIFRKEPDNTTLLVESVKGIEEAQKRLQQLSASGLYEYFLFDPIKGNTVDPSRPSVIRDPFAP